MKWLWVAWALVGCSDAPYVIGRYRPASTDGGVTGSDASAPDGCDDAYPGALLCTGFEEPLDDTFGELVTTRSGELERARDVVFEGEHALRASSEGPQARAVVVARFRPVDTDSLFLRVMVYIPAEQPTEIINLFFLGDDADMQEDFDGLDVNVVDDIPQLFVPKAATPRVMGFGSLPRAEWFCLRMAVSHHDELGTVELFVNDELVLSAEELDTLPERGARQFRAGIDWSSEQEEYFEVYMDELVLDTSPVACP